MADRTAIDTIKGYFYQFDLSILKLLELQNDSDLIVIEGVEDIDIKTTTDESAVQCKYYAKTEYNHSVIAHPIRLMLDHFKDVKDGKKQSINYYLYGYYESGQSKLILPIDIDFLKDKLLTHTVKSTVLKHHVILNLSDVDLTEFLSKLNIDVNAVEYEAQIDNIYSLLMATFKCTRFEADIFYYNNALKVIKEISVQSDIVNRQITKKEFIERISKKRVLFNEWYVEYKGEKAFFKELRSQYFSNLNTSPFERLFLIEIPSIGYSRAEIKEIILLISKKWSKLSKRELKPFCPYIYLHNLAANELVELKQELFTEGFISIDGFDFYGASFNPKSLSKPLIKLLDEKDQTKIKVINDISFIDSLINSISTTKEIYQFYHSNPFLTQTYQNVKKVDIQISEIKNIKDII